MPITAKSKSHSSRVGMIIFVLLIIMLIEEFVTDRSPRHHFALLTLLKRLPCILSRERPLRAWGVRAYRWRELTYLERQGK